MEKNGWNALTGSRSVVHKLKATLFVVAGVLLGAAPALAEKVILPTDLPNGTEGVPYDDDKNPCLFRVEEEKGVALEVYDWRVQEFKLSREDNSFASINATRLPLEDVVYNEWGENPSVSLDLGFAFPYAGATFTELFVSTEHAGLWAGGKGEGPQFELTPCSFSWDVDFTSNSEDGVFVQKGTTTGANPVRFATVKWVAHSVAYEEDVEVQPLHFAVTLYADGRIRFSYGICGDPNSDENAYNMGSVYVFGSDGKETYWNWGFDEYDTALSSAFQDVVFAPSALPPGMCLDWVGDDMHARLTGTPMAAGVFPFRVEVNLGEEVMTRDYTLTIEKSIYPKPILRGYSPVPEDEWSGIEVPVNHTQTFSVDVDANGDGPLTYRWLIDDTEQEGETGASFSYTPDAELNWSITVRCVVSSEHWTDYIEKSWYDVRVTNPVYPEDDTALEATANAAYEHQLSASGGTGSYEFSWLYNVTRAASTYSESGTRTAMTYHGNGIYSLTAANAGIPAFKFLGNEYSEVYATRHGTVYFTAYYPYYGGFNSGYRMLTPIGTYAKDEAATVSYQKFNGGVAIFWNGHRDNAGEDAFNVSARFYNDGKIAFSYGSVANTDMRPGMTVGYSDGNDSHAVILRDAESSDSLSEANDFVLTPPLPTGLSLSREGLLSGTVGVEPGEYAFDILVEDAHYPVKTATAHYTMTVTENGNRKPQLVSATPAEESVTTYHGHEYEFTAVASDPEGGQVSYRWEIVGYSPYDYGGHPTNESTFVFTPAGVDVTGERTLKLYLSDDTWSDVLVKTWTLSIGEGPIEIVTGDVIEIPVDVYYEGGIEISGGGGLADAEWEGDLPRNVTMSYDYGVRIKGTPRDPGDYCLTVSLVGNDGSLAQKTITLRVTGEFTKRDWYVDADSGLWNGDGLSRATAMDSLLCLEDKPLSDGDEIYLVGSDKELANHELMDVFEVIHVIPNGDKDCVQVRVQSSAPAEWGTRAVVASGAQLVFDLNENYYNRYYVGGLYRVAALPENWHNAGFDAISTDGHVDGAPVYEDGWVCLRIIGLGSEDRDEYNRGSLTIRYPDDDTRKSYELVDWDRASVVSVFNEGALPQTLAITGTVHVSQYSDAADGETHTIVRRGSVVDLTYGSLGFAWHIFGRLTVEEDVRFIVDPTLGGNTRLFDILDGKNGLDLPEGALYLELSKPMPAADNDQEWQVIENYMGNGHEFALATASGDNPANYRFTVHDGSLWLVRNHGSSGAYSPEERNPTIQIGYLAGGTNNRFYAHDDSGFVDSGTKEYMCLAPYYAVAEDTKCTFDATKGEKIFRYCDSGVAVSPATVELAFRFPLGGIYYDRIKVYPDCAIGFGDLQGDSKFLLEILGRVTNLQEIYDVVAIESAWDHITVRWADVCSATLMCDGKIRVAYGPLADDYLSNEVTRPTRFICPTPYGFENETTTSYERYWDNTYAGSKDIVFSPTSRPQDVGCGVEIPGVYSYPITRFTNDGGRGPSVDFHVSVQSPQATNCCPSFVDCSPSVPGFVRARSWEEKVFSVDVDARMGAHRRVIWRNGAGTILQEEILLSGISTLTYHAPWHGHDKVTCEAYAVVKSETDTDEEVWIRTSSSVTREWNVMISRDYYIDRANAGAVFIDGTVNYPCPDFYSADVRGVSCSDLIDGDRIFIAPGVYRGRLDLPERIRVQITGSGAADTILDRSGDVGGFTQFEKIFDPSAGGVIRVPCTNSVITGVTIANSRADYTSDTLYGFEEWGVERGGGAVGGVFVSCVFSNCTAGVLADFQGQGGAAFGAVLKNCLLTDCAASQRGGGAANSELWNCTVVNCRAGEAAGGIDGASKAYNSILWYNTVNGEPSNYDKTRRTGMLTDDIPVLKYCCSDVVRFGSSEGMVVVDNPGLTWNHRLCSTSPCVDAGSLAHAPDTETDLAGNPRITDGRISIGAFELPEYDDTAKVRVYLNIQGDGEFTGLSYPIVGEDPVYGPYAVCPVLGAPLTFAIAGREVEAFYVDGEEQPVPASFSFNFNRRTELFFVMPGRTYYVDAAGGDDAATGHDWDQALKTLGEARERVVGGDSILLRPGTYDPVDFTGFKGTLAIGTTGSAEDTFIDAKGNGRCFKADDPTSIVVTGISLVNGRTEEGLAGAGGGVCGGTFVDCVISNCYGYVYGGGAYKATLIRCSVSHNTCDWINEGVITKFGNSGNSWGGGIAVCTADDCLIWANDARGYADDYVHGSGCSASDVRNSFIWGNKVNGVNDHDESNQYIGNGLVGYSVHNVLHRPTEGERESRPTPVMPGTILPGYYDTEEEAMAAAIGKSVDIPADVANALKLNEFAATQAKYSDYTDMFTFVPYPVKKPVQKTMLKSILIPDAYELRLDLKPDVKAEIIADISKSVQEIPIMTLGKTQMTYQINDTKPGLYYAVEFSASIGAKPFEGKRFMALGGSVDVEVEYTDSASGFWRIGVYLTPTGP